MGTEIYDAVRSGAHVHHAERKYFYVLLELKIPVERYEHIAHTVCAAQKFAVLDAGPAMTMHIRRVMAYRQLCEVCRRVFVKQYSHRPKRFRKPDQVPLLLPRALPKGTDSVCRAAHPAVTCDCAKDFASP